MSDIFRVFKVQHIYHVRMKPNPNNTNSKAKLLRHSWSYPVSQFLRQRNPKN